MINNYQNTGNIFSSFPDFSKIQEKKAVGSSNVEAIQQPVIAMDSIDLTASQKKSKTRRRILFGSTLASTILTAGVVGLLFAKGVHGSAFKNKLGVYKQKLTQEMQDFSQLSVKDIPSRISYGAKKVTKGSLDALQASSNITTFKDWFMDRILRTTKATRAFADKCTSSFKKVVDKTLGKKYKKVEVKIKDLSSLLKQYDIKTLRTLDQSKPVTIKGKTITLGECLDLLEAHTKKMETAFGENFSLGALKMRDKKRFEGLKDLPEKIKERFFKNRKSLFNIENYRTYATEDIAKPTQELLRSEIIKARKQVTNNIPSISQDIKTAIDSFSGQVKPSDEFARKSLASLRKSLEAFKGCSGANEVKAREEISKQIISLVDDMAKSTSASSLYSQSEQKMMTQLLQEIRESVVSTGTGSKGALEEIMTILNGLSKEKIIPTATYNNYKKMADGITKGMKNATELEAGEYFLKQAELKVGSAPNDVISVLFPIGVGAYSIAKGDDKDEKISAVLTTCIPLIGTFATFVYGTVKMLSGAKNLVFSAVSGLLLSALGNYADRLYKKYKDSGSVKQVVKDEADKIWTGLEPQIKQFDEPNDSKKAENKK